MQLENNAFAGLLSPYEKTLLTTKRRPRKQTKKHNRRKRRKGKKRKSTQALAARNRKLIQRPVTWKGRFTQAASNGKIGPYEAPVTDILSTQPAKVENVPSTTPRINTEKGEEAIIPGVYLISRYESCREKVVERLSYFHICIMSRCIVVEYLAQTYVCI